MFQEQDNALVAEFRFRNFAEAFSFMTDVEKVSELMHHHPEWKNIYNRVWIRLTTHDEGNVVTEKDRRLAREIEAVFQTYCK